jgi:hypothetical protein
VKLWPWDYLFEPFAGREFPDISTPLLVASFAWLFATIVFYNVRTRQLHRHAPYLQMYEWMMWTGVVVSSLMVIYWVFRFDMIIVLGTLVTGLVMLAWIRFRRFPPYLRAWERQLAKQRYFTRERFSHPESTIKTKASRRRRRRR